MGQLTGLTFEGLGKALAGLGGTIAGGVTHNTAARQTAQTEASSQVSGPIGIFFVFKYGAALGFGLHPYGSCSAIANTWRHESFAYPCT